jgi:hypothetical protein
MSRGVSVKLGCLIGAWAVWLAGFSVLCWCVDEKKRRGCLGENGEVFILFLASFEARDQHFSLCAARIPNHEVFKLTITEDVLLSDSKPLSTSCR